ncbi:MAG: RHS repeat-associated core domain-containing protein, partial [Myxococcota bacterium]
LISNRNGHKVWYSDQIDAFGVPHVVERADAITELYAFEPATWELLSQQTISTSIGGAPIVDLEYLARDANGAITHLMDNRFGTEYLYEYDADYQLLEAHARAPEIPEYAVESGEQGDTTPGPQYFHQRYDYDDLGNLLRKSDLIAPNLSREYSLSPTATSPVHRPHAVHRMDHNGVSEDIDWRFGRITERRGGARQQSLRWDAEGRLKDIIQSNDHQKNLYDAHGHRIRKSVLSPSGLVSDTLYIDQWMELELDQGKGKTAKIHYYNGEAKLATVERNLGTPQVAVDEKHYVLDHLGSVLATLDRQGHELSIHRYLPFGEKGRGAEVDGFGFNGHLKDAETGLQYFGARYYAPELGRFISADPLTPDVLNPLSYTPYAFALNNPINVMDLNGHEPTTLGTMFWIAGATALTAALVGLKQYMSLPPEAQTRENFLLLVVGIPAATFAASLLAQGAGKAVSAAVGSAASTVADKIVVKAFTGLIKAAVKNVARQFIFLGARSLLEGDVDIGDEFDFGSFGFALGVGAATAAAHTAIGLAADSAAAENASSTASAVRASIKHQDIRLHQIVAEYASDRAIDAASQGIQAAIAKGKGYGGDKIKNLFAKFAANAVGGLVTVSASYAGRIDGIDGYNGEMAMGMASLVSKTVSTAALGYIKTSQKKNSASFPESGSSDSHGYPKALLNTSSHT